MKIGLNKACKLAVEHSNWPYIDVITQIEAGYVFGFIDEDGQVPIEPPLIVKNNGEIEDFFPPDHLEEHFSLNTCVLSDTL